MIRALLERFRLARFCVVHQSALPIIQAYQDKKVREVIAYAKKNVAMWHDLIGEKVVVGTETLTSLPVTNKQTYIQHHPDFYIDNSRRLFQVWTETSGTSGVPFRALVARLYAASAFYMDFATLRFLWWKGRKIDALKTTKVAFIKIRARSNTYRLFFPVSQFQTDAQSVYEQLRQFNPEVVVTYPSVLLGLAEFLDARQDLPKLTFPYAVSFGEMISPAVREKVRNTFLCEVYDRYGLQEIGVIGLECREHHGFHINVESVFVEVLDEKNIRVEEGQDGRLVVTDLLNTNMPFIRYDTGDNGKLSSVPCACGLKSPRIWVEGRYTATLTFGTRVFHHLELDAKIDIFMREILQYQFAKKDALTLLVRIIPGPDFSGETSERIRTNVEELVGKCATVRVETVSSIPRAPSGKSKIVSDES